MDTFRRSVVVVAVLSALAIVPPREASAQSGVNWTLETIATVVPPPSCGVQATMTGLGFDLQNRAVAGWQTAWGCGGTAPIWWSRRSGGSWTSYQIVDPTTHHPPKGLPADLALGPDGTPFYAYASIGSAYIFGNGNWWQVTIANLNANPTSSTDRRRLIQYYQDCISAYPNFALAFSPGQTSPNVLTGTRCSYSGWLALDAHDEVIGPLHGAPIFNALVGTGGEFINTDYATGPDGRHHVVYFYERGGPAGWGVAYNNGTPGHELQLAVPHRNRGAEVSVVAGQDGRIHVAIGGIPTCDNPFEGGLLYATSVDGISWAKTFVDTVSGRRPSIALDGEGNPVISYSRFGSEVRLARKTAASWTTERVISQSPGTDDASSTRLAFDHAARPHVLLYDKGPRNVALAQGPVSGPGLTLSHPGDQSGTVGQGVSLALSASGEGPLSYAASCLPPGVSIDPVTGVVTGTLPSSPGQSQPAVVVTDGAGNTAVVTFTWTFDVPPPNSAPVASDATGTTSEDTAAGILLPASDGDGDALTYAIATAPAHGTVTIAGSIATYTPAADYNGADAFTFTASDGTATSNVATVAITVLPVNDVPAAADAQATTNEDTAADIPLHANDVDGDALTYAVATAPAHGTVTIAGSIATYTPAPDYNGADAFTFTASDGTAISNVAAVAITVLPVNDIPAAADAQATTNEDTAVDIPLHANDVDGDALTYTIATAPAHGTVTIAGSTATYTPAADYNGADAFTFTASDGTATSNVAAVAITVLPVNDIPAAADAQATTNEDTAVDIPLHANDVDGDALTYAIATAPAHGTVTITGSTATYTPAGDYNGADAFTFTASDGTATSNVAAVAITVLPVNDPPQLLPVLSQTVHAGTTITFALSATDIDGDALEFGASGLPVGASVDATTGAFTWTTTVGQAGAHVIAFHVTDSGGLGATQQATLTVVLPIPTLDCSVARPSLDEIWPPNHKQTHVIDIRGFEAELLIDITAVLQDEPTDTLGDGATAIDGGGVGTPSAWVRAERSGTVKVPGNGRVYEIRFTATAGNGDSCSGRVLVGVPHDRGKGPAVDDGIRYDSTVAGGPQLP
jgi:hypothetical protein